MTANAALQQPVSTEHHIVQVTKGHQIIVSETFLSIYNAYRHKSDLEWEYRDPESIVCKVKRGYKVELIERNSK